MDNAEKNQYVKQQMTDALLRLLKEKELREITISDLTSAAQVSRISFYRNYQEKEDILKEYIGMLFGEWTREYDRSPDRSHDRLMKMMFQHFSDHADFYLLLKERGQFLLLKDFLISICGPKPEYPNAGAYVAAYFANGLYGWIEEWFARGMQETPDEMIVMLTQENQ